MPSEPTVGHGHLQIGHSFTGLEKAAVLMFVAGDSHAGILFERINLEEIKDITQKMSSLGCIKGQEVETLLREFKALMGGGERVVGSYDTAKQLLSQILDEEKVSMIMKDIGGTAGRNIWEKLSKIDETVLATFLKNEYPQTIAVVLSRIKTDHAARVMAQLPKEIAIEAMMRMLRMENVQEDILTDVEDTLRAEFMANWTGKPPQDQHEYIADIFNHFDRATETEFLAMLEERNKESAEIVRSLMFTFDDLSKLDGPAIQVLLRNIDNAKLSLALKGAKDELRELFMNNMSERAAKILREDMENSGPVRVRDVEEVQAELVAQTKQLIDNGEIMIAGDSDDEMIS